MRLIDIFINMRSKDRFKTMKKANIIAENTYLKERGEEMDDILEFTIPEWAISPLINGDDSGLEQEDIAKLDDFVNRTITEYGNANFMLPSEGEMDLGFKWKNDIDSLGNNCYKLLLRPTSQITY
jgi:hypothetical protein